MTLIMLCGQGGSGKSTYANKLIKNLKGNNIIISMDKIKNLYSNKTLEEFNLLYVNNIQMAINKNMITLFVIMHKIHMT